MTTLYIRSYFRYLGTISDFLLDDNYRSPQGFDVTMKNPVEEHLAVEEDYPNYKDVVDDDLKQQVIVNYDICVLIFLNSKSSD